MVANGSLQLDHERNLTYDNSSSYHSYLTMASGTTLILNYTDQQSYLDLILQGATVELLQTQTWSGDVTLSGTNTFNVAATKRGPHQAAAGRMRVVKLERSLKPVTASWCWATALLLGLA